MLYVLHYLTPNFKSGTICNYPTSFTLGGTVFAMASEHGWYIVVKKQCMTNEGNSVVHS